MVPNHTHRSVLVVATVALFFVCSSAVFCDTLAYVGETTSMTSYAGLNASPAFWDYAYNINGWSAFTLTPIASRHTLQWGIIVDLPVLPTQIWSPAHWTGAYFSSFSSGITDLSSLVGHQAVVWTYDTTGLGSATGFHFQGGGSPIQRAYAGTAAGGTAGPISGTAFSESSVPEPGTIALGAMCLLGVCFRRRWHKNGQRQA